VRTSGGKTVTRGRESYVSWSVQLPIGSPFPFAVAVVVAPERDSSRDDAVRTASASG
jgi:hypothetical protein